MTIDQIAEAVCEVHGIGEDELSSRKRQKIMVLARQMMMCVMRKHLGMMLEDIGEHFEYHHSSIMHNISTCEDDVVYDCEIRDRYNEVLEMLGVSVSRLFIEI